MAEVQHSLQICFGGKEENGTLSPQDSDPRHKTLRPGAIQDTLEPSALPTPSTSEDSRPTGTDSSETPGDSAIGGLSSAYEEDRDVLARQLIRFHHDWTAAINRRDWAELAADKCAQHYHPSYRLECRFTSRFMSYNETIETLMELYKGHPNFKVNVVEASATIDEKARVATVFFHTEWSGAPLSLTTQVIHIIEWRWVDGMWLCLKANLLRGLDEMV